MTINELLASPWLPAAAVFGLLGALLLLASLAALFRLRPFRFLLRLLAGLVALVVGAFAAVVGLGTQGYRALTHEAVAAQMRVLPLGPQRFSATLRFPDGRESTFELAGDEVYVDAHILKWKPIANRLGLHTAYELDRIAGRYHSLKDELVSPRTLYSLGADKPIDLFNLRRRYTLLTPLLDAEYGSASFVPVTAPAELDVRISTTGVLIRERKP
jgi:hypothetical protein